MSSKFSRNNTPQPTPIICKAPPPDFMPPIWPEWEHFQFCTVFPSGWGIEPVIISGDLKNSIMNPNEYSGGYYSANLEWACTVVHDAADKGRVTIFQATDRYWWSILITLIDLEYCRENPFFGELPRDTPNFYGGFVNGSVYN